MPAVERNQQPAAGATAVAESTRTSRILTPPVVLFVAAVLLLPALIFLGARLLLPGDATKVVLVAPPRQVAGLSVIPRASGDTPLQAGDTVLRLAGRPVDERVHDALTGWWHLPTAPPAAVIPYTVLRNGRTLTVDLALVPFPFLPALRQDASIFIFLIYVLLVSLFVFSRRQQLPAARLFLWVSSALISNGTVFNLGLQTSDLLRPWLVALWLWQTAGMDAVLMALLLHFALVFPRRHPLVQGHPARLIGVYLGTWVIYGAYVALRWSSARSATMRLLLLAQATTPMMVAYFALVLATWLSGYRTARASTERRQLGWIIWGMVVGVVPFSLLSLLPTALFGAPVGANFGLVGLFLCAIPTAAMIAILRERLFDIDSIINRTLVYGTLTTILGLIYVGSVLLLQRLVAPFTDAQSTVGIVASTLIILALFQPLRRRIQLAIDRRFFRTKYNAAQTLEAFSARLRDEVDLDTLTDELVAVAEEMVHPAHISLWLRPVDPPVQPAEPSVREARTNREPQG